MEIQNIILIVFSVLLFALSFYVLFRNIKNPISISFFVMVFGAAVWVVTNALDYIALSIWMVRSSYLGAILIAVGFFYFSFYFPYKQRNISIIISLLTIFLAILLIIILYTNTAFVKEIIPEIDSTRVIYGPIFPVFNIYFLTLWVWGLVNFITKYKTADGIHKWQIKNIFWAISFSLIAGVTINLILPWVFDIWRFGWLGPMFSVIFFGFVSYILFKKNI